MWSANFKTETKDANSKQIWEVLTDINNWSAWDEEVEWTKLDGQSRLGAKFILKPKGGPKVNIEVTEYEPCTLHTDLSSLPLAKMEMRHTLKQVGDTCHLGIEVKIWGPLTFLWKKVIGETQVKGFADQTAKMIARAKELSITKKPIFA